MRHVLPFAALVLIAAPVRPTSPTPAPGTWVPMLFVNGTNDFTYPLDSSRRATGW